MQKHQRAEKTGRKQAHNKRRKCIERIEKREARLRWNI